jgi:glycosyltransferase involved in cell wall biosynthesis
MNERVSILIPCFNAEQFIAEAIKSAMHQTWPNKEIIVVDDGSSDRSYEVAQSFISTGIVRVYQQENSGACKARNVAFEKASGDYIQFLDSDDVLHPNKIERQMHRALNEHEDCVISGSLVRFLSDEEFDCVANVKQILDKDWEDPLDWLYYSWMGKGMGQTSIWLTPRHLILKAGPWNEGLSVNQDGDFFSRVLLSAKSICFEEDSIVYYRSGNTNSVSQIHSIKKARDLLLSYTLYERNVLMFEDSFRMRYALGHLYGSFVYIYFDQYPELADQAGKYLSSLGLGVHPRVGGSYFKAISKFAGFKNSLSLRSFLRRLIN